MRLAARLRASPSTLTFQRAVVGAGVSVAGVSPCRAANRHLALHQHTKRLLSHLHKAPTTPHFTSNPHSTKGVAAAQQHGVSTTQQQQLSPPPTAPPLIYHPLYSAPQLAPGHRFPMQVFGRIYEQLLNQGIVQPSQVQQW